MVLKSHEHLSDVNMIRSQNQNGSCSSNGPSVLPLKWKTRTVSVVRDFPPGCGPIVQLVNVDSQEANSSSSLVNNNNGATDAGTSVNQVESLPHDVSKSTEDGKTGLLVDEISDPANEVIKVDDDNGGSCIKETIQKMKFPQRRVSAVRDFPPYCGLNATEPTKEERIRINGKRSVTDCVVVGGEESNGSVKDNSLHKTQSNEIESNESLMENQESMANKSDIRSDTASEIITKVCKELVVYTRDNNNSPKKKPLIDTSDEDSEENHEDESIQNSEIKPEVVMPIKSLAPIEENIRNVSGQRKKVRHKKLPEKRSMDDIINPGFVRGERSVVIGVMAPSFSPEVILLITPKESKSEVIPSITPKKSKSEVTPSITPKKSKSEVTPSIKPKKPKKSKSEAGPSIPSKKSKSEVTLSITPKESKSEVTPSITPKKSKSEATPSIKPKKSKKSKSEEGPSITPKKSKSKKVKAAKVTSIYTGTLDMIVRDEDVEEEEEEEEETKEQGNEVPNSREVDVALPPFGPRSSDSARNRIRRTLRLFQVLCRKILQNEESKASQNDGSKSTPPIKRVDLAARAIIEEKGKAPDRGKKTYGSVPGVEVGDEFQYRVELALVGIHWPFQGGIDYIKHGKSKTPVAVSVVASGGYDNELNKPECLIYSGSGGIGKDKQIEDQKLERGNVALKNNIDLKIPVRVIRGYKGKSTDSSYSSTSSSSSSSSKIMTTYIYDGLYTVKKYWQEKGPHGNLVYKFELQRIPGQPELALREVKSKKFKIREGICVDDITHGKEKKRISAINTIDDEKPPSFTYITKIVYPDKYRRQAPPTGCDCTGRCSDNRCKCAAKNGGEIPYNHNGAIVEAKPLVYECGPSCKCPPSCYNRVTQHGMKIQLEIFKTESRGWGVRSLTSISSGSFICEYVGELLEDTEAEKRTGNDEYLFDIGQNYSDTGMDPDTGTGMGSGSGGFTIDAANYGNVGRFINHSCTPNLYAQNLLYDQEDKRMPHIMLFAAENIPPLQELTYHYNYAVDTVHDSDGNIKVKKCFCGSSECTGRLY